jgi:hypothetical protein
MRDLSDGAAGEFSDERKIALLSNLFSELRVILLHRNPSLEHATRKIRAYIAEVCQNPDQWIEGATVFDLNMPGRVATVLSDRGFVTLRAVLGATAKELEAEKDLGPRVVESLRKALKERRLHLRGEGNLLNLPSDPRRND